MVIQELINEIEAYLHEINEEMHVLIAADRNKYQANDADNPRIKFFAAIYLLDHVVADKPLDVDEKDAKIDSHEALLRAAIKQKGSISNPLNRVYEKFKAIDKSKNYNSQLNVESATNDLLFKMRALITRCAFLEQDRLPALNQLKNLFGPIFLINLKPYNNYIREVFDEKLTPVSDEDFFDDDVYLQVLWNGIFNIEDSDQKSACMEELKLRVNRSWIHNNLLKIVKMINTQQDLVLFRNVFNLNNIWPVEHAERIFDPRGLNLTLIKLSSNFGARSYVGVCPLINTPRAAFLAANTISSIEDFKGLLNEHHQLMKQIVKDKATAISLFNRFFINDIDELVNIFSASKNGAIIITVMLEQPEILAAFFARAESLHIERILLAIGKNDYHRCYPIFDFNLVMTCPKNLMAGLAARLVRNEIDLNAHPIINKHRLKILAVRELSIVDKTMDTVNVVFMNDFEDPCKNKYLLEAFKHQAIAIKYFKEFFQNNIRILIKLSRRKNQHVLAMLQHPMVLQMAINAIGKDDTIQLGWFIAGRDYDADLIVGLVARPDIMLKLVRELTPEDGDPIALLDSLVLFLPNHIQTVLNYPQVIEYIASLFKTSQQLIKLRIRDHFPRGDARQEGLPIHLVYKFVECLARKKMSPKQFNDKLPASAANLSAATTTAKKPDVKQADAKPPSNAGTAWVLSTAFNFLWQFGCRKSQPAALDSTSVVTQRFDSLLNKDFVIEILENDEFLRYFDGYQVIGRLNSDYLRVLPPDTPEIVNDYLFRECKLAALPAVSELASTATAAAGTATAPSFKAK